MFFVHSTNKLIGHAIPIVPKGLYVYWSVQQRDFSVMDSPHFLQPTIGRYCGVRYCDREAVVVNCQSASAAGPCTRGVTTVPQDAYMLSLNLAKRRSIHKLTNLNFVYCYTPNSQVLL